MDLLELLYAMSCSSLRMHSAETWIQLTLLVLDRVKMGEGQPSDHFHALMLL